MKSVLIFLGLLLALPALAQEAAKDPTTKEDRKFTHTIFLTGKLVSGGLLSTNVIKLTQDDLRKKRLFNEIGLQKDIQTTHYFTKAKTVFRVSKGMMAALALTDLGYQLNDLRKDGSEAEYFPLYEKVSDETTKRSEVIKSKIKVWKEQTGSFIQRATTGL